MSDDTANTEAATEAGAVQLIATLGIAGLISGLAIVGIYEVTLPTITANKKAALQAAIFEVVPGAQATQAFEIEGGTLVADPDESAPEVFGAYDAEGTFLGYAIPAAGPGFQDTIEILYGYDPKDQTVIGMRVLTSRETPGLGDKIIKDLDFVSQFETLDASGEIGLTKGVAESKSQIEAITGATISSRAIVKIMNGSLAHRKPQMPEVGHEPVYTAPVTEDEGGS